MVLSSPTICTLVYKTTDNLFLQEVDLCLLILGIQASYGGYIVIPLVYILVNITSFFGSIRLFF